MLTREELKALLKENGLKQWQLADALGICEWWLCKRLRYPISEDFEEEIRDAIARLNKGAE